MQESSIGIRVSVECSTTTTAQQREGFDRVFGHYDVINGGGIVYIALDALWDYRPQQ